MLIPRYSIRMILLVTSMAAAIALLAGFAVKGHFWAAAIVAGFLFLLAAFFMYGLTFAIVWGLSQLIFKRDRVPKSPAILQQETRP